MPGHDDQMTAPDGGFWVRYFDSFEGLGGDKGANAALSVLLLPLVFAVWLGVHATAFVVRLIRR